MLVVVCYSVIKAVFPHDSVSLPGNVRPEPRGAFTLVELLVVIAVISLLAAAAVSGFNSIAQGRGVTEAADQISSAVELGRSEAIARQTYVWLMFQPQTNAGNLDLRLGIFYSKDGTAKITTNTQADNVVIIGKPLLIRSVGVRSLTALSLGTNDFSAAVDISTNNPITSPMKFGTTVFDQSASSITIMPLGEVTAMGNPTATNGFEPLLGIGLQGTRGTTMTTNNDAAVLIDGSVGNPTIFRK